MLEVGIYSVAKANDWCNLDMAVLRKIKQKYLVYLTDNICNGGKIWDMETM